MDLQRQYQHHLFNTYIPTFGLMIICQTTLYFNKEHFKTNVPVTITTMLGLLFSALYFILLCTVQSMLVHHALCTLYWFRQHISCFMFLFSAVMYTLYMAVSNKLPPTSYIKFIDVWLIFGLTLPFTVFFLHFLIEHIPRYQYCFRCHIPLPVQQTRGP